MNLTEVLAKRVEKNNWESIAEYILKHPEKLNALVEFGLSNQKEHVQNASAVLGKIHDRNQDILRQFYPTFIDHLTTAPIDAFKRMVVRIFQDVLPPESHESILFDILLNYLRDPEEPIAVKAFGITAARKICEKYPELAIELSYSVELLIENKISAGVVNRAKKELIFIQKIAKKKAP